MPMSFLPLGELSDPLYPFWTDNTREPFSGKVVIDLGRDVMSNSHVDLKTLTCPISLLYPTVRYNVCHAKVDPDLFSEPSWRSGPKAFELCVVGCKDCLSYR